VEPLERLGKSASDIAAGSRQVMRKPQPSLRESAAGEFREPV
jgi:hypothetical protein